MKSEVIEYIKNNTYIEELFLDFIDEFKEQYDLLKNKEKIYRLYELKLVS